MPCGAELLDHGRHDVLVLAPEQAALAGMRVERADADPRLLDAEVQKRLVGQREDAAQALGRHPLGHVGQRHVGRDMRDPQAVVRQHHAAALAARQVGQDLGVAGIGVARLVERLLVDRRGDDRIDLARQRQLHGPLDRGEGEPAGLGAEPAGRDRLLGGGRLDQPDVRPAAAMRADSAPRMPRRRGGVRHAGRGADHHQAKARRPASRGARSRTP